MWYDVFVIAVLIVCIVRGAMRGVIWQLAGIAGLVLCLVFAETISVAVGPHIGLAEPLNHWVAMFGAYLVFSFLSFGVARMIHGAMEKAQMTEFNRHLGAVFGLIKGIAFCLVLTFFIVTLSPSARAMLKNSRSGYAAAVIMDRLHPIMPEKLHDSLDKYIHQLDTPDLPLKHHHDHQHAAGNQPFPAGPGTNEDLSPRSADPWDWSGSGSAAANPIDEIVRRIPGFGQDQARPVVEQAIHNTPPEMQSALIGELKSAAPEMIMAVAKRWLNQSAPPPTTPAVSQPQVPKDREGLIQAIAAMYSSIPSERTRYVQQIDGWLRGLPDNISLGVLQDWRADLSDGGTDPDPQTTADTSVDKRIIRQLTLQRVSVFQLSQELQDRLRTAAQR